MVKSSSGKLLVSWDDYHRVIEELALKVHASGWQFDHVLCLARGGLRPGDVLSRLFRLPLAILSTSSYREDAGTVRGELALASNITSTAGPLSGRVLLVDDLVDSGVTLLKVQQHLQAEYHLITEVRSAVIWYKACSIMQPDYYVDYLADNPWIVQPFEDYDDLTLDNLRIRQG